MRVLEAQHALAVLAAAAIAATTGGACTGLGGPYPTGSGGGTGTGPNGGAGAGDQDATVAAGSGGIEVDNADPFAPTSSTATVTAGSGGTGGGPLTGSGGADACPEPVVVPVTTAQVTVDDSNSYASPLIVGELTSDAGWDATRPLPVRPHEYLNYYAQPLEGELWSLDGDLRVRADARLADIPDGDMSQLMELAVSVSTGGEPPPLPDITFLIDTSPSMAGEPAARVEAVLAGAALRLVTQAQSVAVVSAAADADERLIRPMLPWPGGSETMAQIAQRVATPSPGPRFGDALREALQISRAQADASGRPGVVLVVTDGRTAPDEALLAEVTAERGGKPAVRVAGIGVGPARSYTDQVLEELTDRSGGAYLYAPTAEEAEAAVAERFVQLTQVAAQSVHLMLELPLGVDFVEVTGGQGAGSESVKDGQNLGAESSMVFHLLLRVGADVEPCAAMGLRVAWTDAAAEAWSLPAEGSQPVLIRDALAADGTFGLRRVSTLAAVTDALRGPTAPRLRAASAQLDALLGEAPGDSLTELCGPLSRRCGTQPGAQCVGCSAPASP